MRHQGRIAQSPFRRVIALFCLLMPVTVCSPASGAEVKLVPSCEIKEEFNDNIYLTSTGRQSDFIRSLIPGIAFLRATERHRLELSTGLTWHNYTRTADIKTMDYQYNARLASRLTPLDDIGLSAAFVRDTRPDSVNSATGLPANNGQDHYQYSAQLGRQVSTASSAALEYSYIQDTYDYVSSQDSHVHNAALSLSQDLGSVSPMLKGTVSTNFNRAIYQNSNNDYYSLNAAVRKKITDKATLNLALGGKYIHSTVVKDSTGKNDSWSAIGSVSYNYAGEKSFGSVALTHDYPAATGNVQVIRVTSLGVTLGRKPGEKSTLQGAASYVINQSLARNGEFATKGSDDRVINVKADYAYKISKFFDVGIQYAYYRVLYGNVDARVSQNTAIVRILGKYPFSR
jgi:hypothetical protein